MAISIELPTLRSFLFSFLYYINVWSLNSTGMFDVWCFLYSTVDVVTGTLTDCQLFLCFKIQFNHLHRMRKNEYRNFFFLIQKPLLMRLHINIK